MRIIHILNDIFNFELSGWSIESHPKKSKSYRFLRGGNLKRKGRMKEGKKKM